MVDGIIGVAEKNGRVRQGIIRDHYDCYLRAVLSDS